MANSILSNNPTQLLTKAKVNVSDWTSYTPSFQGFGTPSNVDVEYARSGDTLKVRGSFTCGTPTAVEARIGLPSGLVIGGTSGTSVIPSGKAIRHANSNGSFHFLATIGDSYVNVGFSDRTTASQQQLPITADFFSLLGETESFYFEVPIQGWSSEAEFLAPLVQPKTAFLKNQLPNNTLAQTASVSGTYFTINLNTLEGQSDFLSLVSNTFTLKPGKYLIEGESPASAGGNSMTGQHKAKIRNITDSTDAIIGSSEYTVRLSSASITSTVSLIRGYIEVTEEKTFELQHAVTTSGGQMGTTCNFGDDEVYAQLKITKLL